MRMLTDYELDAVAAGGKKNGKGPPSHAGGPDLIIVANTNVGQNTGIVQGGAFNTNVAFQLKSGDIVNGPAGGSAPC